jgi:hypothetical protein
MGPPAVRVVISVVALVAFCLALPWIGYPAAAFAFRDHRPPVPRRPLDDRAGDGR